MKLIQRGIQYSCRERLESEYTIESAECWCSAETTRLASDYSNPHYCASPQNLMCHESPQYKTVEVKEKSFHCGFAQNH